MGDLTPWGAGGKKGCQKTLHFLARRLRPVASHRLKEQLLYGELCEVPGLRSWLVSRLPYALLYVEQAAYLDVLRVLHQHADIPAQLADAW
jgi:toxin ParE1/3/4